MTLQIIKLQLKKHSHTHDEHKEMKMVTKNEAEIESQGIIRTYAHAFFDFFFH